MSPGDILEIGREAIFVLVKMATPLMMVALFVGLTIALFQALTQVQEMTLSFVPKILAMFFALILLLPFMSANLGDFAKGIFDRMFTL